MPLLHDADIILLLSVDVVGSTAFKSRHPSAGMEPGWVPAMQHFYSHTIRTVMRKLNAVRSARSGFRGRGPMPRLTVHKVIGDEVLFACSPQTPLDFADSLELFTNLVAELNEEYTRDYGFGIHSPPGQRPCCPAIVRSASRNWTPRKILTTSSWVPTSTSGSG